MSKKIIYFKMSSENIQSTLYAGLSQWLKSHPHGVVGMETPDNGVMQHYFYELHRIDPETTEVRRYPIRRLEGQEPFSFGMYSSLKANEDGEYFGTPEQAPPQSLPKESCYFVTSDELHIHAMRSAAREKHVTDAETAPYFPLMKLTQQQQMFLYHGQVQKEVSFQEELKKLLDNKDLSITTKEAALIACISNHSPDLSGDALLQAQVIKSVFLSLAAILNYPASILCSPQMVGEDSGPPTIGAIRDYYVACIQSHLPSPLSPNEIYGYGNPTFALGTKMLLGTTASTASLEAPTYKPLSTQDELCLDALNLLLMSRADDSTVLKLQQTMLQKPEFKTVLDDLVAIVADLKDMVDTNKETTSKPQYEMIYREFLAMHELNISGLKQLTTLTSAHEALTSLQVRLLGEQLQQLGKRLKSASEVDSEYMRKQLMQLQNHPNLAIQEQAEVLLLGYFTPIDEQIPIFLDWVAKGKQDEAEQLLAASQDPQALLQQQGRFTDYSGRTFNCSAYEYAYWAKDTHMCRMLEKHMDEETKTIMLQRVNAIEAEGLTYQQGGKTATPSKHFSFQPLKDALQGYIDEYNKWNGEDKSFPVVQQAWMKVGAAQADLPVHVVNEYCRPDRSFYPLTDTIFKEDKLPRTTEYYNHMGQLVSLFPLVASVSGGLGVDFALLRGRGARGGGGRAWGLGPGGGAWVVGCDLAAISRLDEVRAGDLTLLRKNLERAVTERDLGMA